VAPVGWAAQAAHALGDRLGRTVESAQTANSIKKFFFFFKSIL
jgi:hypothetical protein